jgi:hypothetical protein
LRRGSVLRAKRLRRRLGRPCCEVHWQLCPLPVQPHPGRHLPLVCCYPGGGWNLNANTISQSTCGAPIPCDANGCNGAYNGGFVPVCRGNFGGCQCILQVSNSRIRALLQVDYVAHTAQSQCPSPRASCTANGCAGKRDSDGIWRCKGNNAGCYCYFNTNFAMMRADNPSTRPDDEFELWLNDNECGE